MVKARDLRVGQNIRLDLNGEVVRITNISIRMVTTKGVIEWNDDTEVEVVEFPTEEAPVAKAERPPGSQGEAVEFHSEDSPAEEQVFGQWAETSELNQGATVEVLENLIREAEELGLPYEENESVPFQHKHLQQWGREVQSVILGVTHVLRELFDHFQEHAGDPVHERGRQDSQSESQREGGLL